MQGIYLVIGVVSYFTFVLIGEEYSMFVSHKGRTYFEKDLFFYLQLVIVLFIIFGYLFASTSPSASFVLYVGLVFAWLYMGLGKKEYEKIPAPKIGIFSIFLLLVSIFFYF